MSTLRQLQRDAFEELKESLENYPDQDPYDTIFEIADSSVPVYTHELMKLAAEDITLATAEPELGPAFDGSPTPVNIVAANVFEAIHNYLHENIGLLNDEMEEEDE